PSGNIVCADGSTQALTRQDPDGTTTYTRTNVGGTEWETAVTDAQGNETDIWFQNTGPDFYETKRQINQNISGTQTLLRTIHTCYGGALPDCSATAISNLNPISVTTVLENNMQSRVTTFYNANALPTEVDEYDFASGGPPSTPMRKRIIAYAPLSNNILDRVQS